MEDKRLKGVYSKTLDQELQFTKENRQKVFEQIREIDHNLRVKSSYFTGTKKFVPLTVSLLMVSLCMFLFLPSILNGDVNEKSNSGDVNSESNTSIVNTPISKNEKNFTTLITLKSKKMDNRVYLNLLFSYSGENKMLKVVSIPDATYAPISDKDDGTILYDKLLFAYQYGGAENVRSTVSKLFDLPIDYYAIIDLETLDTLVDAMNGIDFDLEEDLRLRGLSTVAFEFHKGTNHLNGEQLVSMMMAATEDGLLAEENLLSLMKIVMNKTEKEIVPTQYKQIITQVETNASIDHPIKVDAIKVLSLKNGRTDSRIDEEYYMVFESGFLKSVSQELMTFDQTSLQSNVKK